MAVVGNRYDRQIRLWGEGGQNSIENASVCLLGSSALATEILKNLILPGIGKFCVVDDALVTEIDLGQNFFVKQEDLGKLRASVVAGYLSELNPAVKGSFRNHNPRDINPSFLRYLLDYTIVISTNMDERTAAKLGEHFFDNGICFIYARVCGMFGYLRLCLRQHTVWNVHEEHPTHDFRLDEPFDELLQMADAENLDEMDHERHSHTPYILLYLKALAKWRATAGADHALDDSALPIPDTTAKRREFLAVLLSMRMPSESGSLDEENFNEAKRNLLKSFHTKRIPDEVAAVFEDIKTAPIEEIQRKFNVQGLDASWREFLRPFWVFATALRQFADAHGGRLPLSGKLPDMTSDSARYVKLQEIYRNKAMRHAEEVFRTAKCILEDRRKFFAELVSNATDAGYASDAALNGDSKTRLDSAESESDFQLSSLDPIHVPTAQSSLHSNEVIHPTPSSDRMDVDENASKASTISAADRLFSQELSRSECFEFCKNAAKIAVQNGSSLQGECVVGKIIKSLAKQPPMDDETSMSSSFRVNPLVWILMMKAMDRFWYEKDRFPGTNGVPCTIDSKDLKRRLLELVGEAEGGRFSESIVKLVPDEAIDEVCRFGAAEIHPIAAIMGGVIAQETIKLITHQYLPLNNALIYDGHSQNACMIVI